MQLEGSVALVTGSNRGLGRALVEAAKRLAAGRTMWVLTDDDNVAAKRTYGAAGGTPSPNLLYRWRGG